MTADAQAGVILSRQLRDSGLSRRARERLVAEGWLRAGLGSAFTVGPAEASDWQRGVAAVLSCGAGTVLSHSSAAAAWDLPHLVAGPEPEVSVEVPKQSRRTGIVVHRVQALPPSDFSIRDAIPVTSPVRTLIDLAPRLSASLLAKVVDEGSIRRIWTVEDLISAIENSGRRTRLSELRAVLAGRRGTEKADSNLELRTQSVLRPLGFVAAHQVVFGGRVVILDLARPDLRVAVECDGWWVRRRSRGKFDDDRRKGNLLTSSGWTLIRVTSAMSDEEILATAVEALLLGARRLPV